MTAAWVLTYVDASRRAGGSLAGIRRRGERAKACLKVLIDAAESLTSLAPAAIGAPSAAQAIGLAEIAGSARAAGAVIADETYTLETAPDSRFLEWLARRSAAWGGQLSPALMAASDGDTRPLLHEGAASELNAGLQAGRPADAAWLRQPAYSIDGAAAFLAELNASARPRPGAVHLARAEALDQQIAVASGGPYAQVQAHAFAVHHLTGIYGPGDDALRATMLRLVATYPPHDRATLQASKVAALLSDALGPRARMALLDHIIVLLGPGDGDASVRMALARDSALVLLLIDADAAEPGGPAEQEEPVDGADAAQDATPSGMDAVAEIARQAERAIESAGAEREARYQQAVERDSLADALAIVRDAAADDDHEQAWLLLQDIARRHPEAEPGDLVTVAPDVLGPVALDSDEDFDGPGAGCFTVLSPAPAEAAATVDRVAPRLLNVDDRGVEHPDSEIAHTVDAYTPNYLHEIVWCDRGAQVMLDTKGSISAPMARTMVGIIVDALVDARVPALVTGWIPDLDARMTRWNAADDPEEPQDRQLR